MAATRASVEADLLLEVDHCTSATIRQSMTLGPAAGWLLTSIGLSIFIEFSLEKIVVGQDRLLGPSPTRHSVPLAEVSALAAPEQATSGRPIR